MIVFPAVDIRQGQCVRLRQGQPETETVYDKQPLAAATRWVREGAETLHVVDLDAALGCEHTNREAIKEVIRRIEVPVQVGGGLRRTEQVEEMLAAGAARVVVGTRAVTDPAWAARLCDAFPARIVIALDAREGEVAIEGWKKASGRPLVGTAQQLQKAHPAAFLYTDIVRDGMMSRPHFEGVKALVDALAVPVIASGGIASAADIRELGQCGAHAAVVGKALYEKKLRLQEALEIASTCASALTLCPPGWKSPCIPE